MLQSSQIQMLAAFTVASVLMGCGKSQPKIENLEADLLLKCDVRELQATSPLPTQVILQKGSGMYVEVTYQPKKPLQETLEGVKVQPVNRWPMAFLLFPAGDTHDSGKTVMLFLKPYSRAGRIPLQDDDEADFPVLSGQAPYWFNNGFTGAPAESKRQKRRPDEFLRYTYLNAPDNGVKDFDFELVVWPCFDQTKASEIQLGRPVVLQKGQLTVE